MMKNKKSALEAYREERETAIITLKCCLRGFQETICTWAQRAGYEDEVTAACLQAYTAAETELLKLMKEESEESDHE